MYKLIITTVGTSVIGNKLYPVKEFEDHIQELKDGRSLDERVIGEIISQTASNMIAALNNNRPNEFLSAEIASLRAFKNGKGLGLARDDLIVLLSSDTVDGLFCARVNKAVLEKAGWCRVNEPVIITGLKTKNIKKNEDISGSFKDAGLLKLKEEVERVLAPIYTESYFNITGGFKAAIPFITILAFEKRMSLIYLYEESNDLIVIPPPEIFKCSYDTVRQGIRIPWQLSD